ncbi:hypothetical protein [Plastoroseomonas arctica]|uniref:Uncharacterized protein n=1 Tax=Plastoroseomonas arctica TaxID=1509237 RepID=A0AAF1KMA6_9PROT|nr:hypothetical protein [Plastoroseomonas arctica]MBR0656111.1 hypothetical protein [Plastoroseomonas arctica]
MNKTLAALRRGDMTDVTIACFVAVLLYGLMLLFALIHQGGALFSAALLAGILGAALGWVIGIGLSPYEAKERKSFSDLGKLVAGFLGGYGLSKLDPALSRLGSAGHGLADAVVKDALALAGVGSASMLIAAVLTYITRHYWDDAQNQGRSAPGA